MKKLTIKKNEQLVTSLLFDSESKLTSWLDINIAAKTFGEPERIEYKSVLVNPAVMLDGEIITPAEYDIEEVVIPAEFTVEIEDIAAKIAQEKINAEALAYLKSTDWLIIRELDSGVPCPEEIKEARQAARNKIV